MHNEQSGRKHRHITGEADGQGGRWMKMPAELGDLLVMLVAVK